MAKPAFTIDEFLPKIPASTKISKSFSSAGLLDLELTSFPASEILSRLQGAIDRANQRLVVDLKAALSQALRSKVWATPSGNDDIFDSGKLLSSGKVTANQDGITIAYDAPYAALVHFGGYINPYGNASARVYLPPRPWVESVLNGGGPVPQFDIASYYEQEIRTEFN
jgi:hypothetical protein